MSDETTRQELLAALSDLSDVFLDWRLGQTLANLAMAAGHPDAGGIGDLEDTDALAAARRLLEQNAVRRGVAMQGAVAPELAHSV